MLYDVFDSKTANNITIVQVLEKDVSVGYIVDVIRRENTNIDKDYSCWDFVKSEITEENFSNADLSGYEYLKKHIKENEQPIIKIRKDLNCYTAIFVDGLPMIQAITEFGTNEIPTAFTEKASSLTVIREIRRLNPDCKVVFA